MAYAIDDRVIATVGRGRGWRLFASLRRRGKVVAVTLTQVPRYTVRLDEPVALRDGQVANVLPELLERDLTLDNAPS